MRLLKKLEIRDKSRDRFLLNVARLVGSRGDIIPRPSQLDPDVRVSLHPAPDVLKLSFCSCERNRGNFREQSGFLIDHPERSVLDVTQREPRPIHLAVAMIISPTSHYGG
jgi:hypothetical protein